MHRRRWLAGATGTALALLITVASPAVALNWGAERTLSASGLMNWQRTLAVSGSAAHVAYWEAGAIKYRRSANGGSTWGPERTLQPAVAGTNFFYVSVAAAGQRVLALYNSSMGSSDHEIWIRRSADGGATWKPRQRLLHDTSASGIGSASVGVTGANVVIAWNNATSGQVIIRRSTDGGATWGLPQILGITNYSTGSTFDVHALVTAAANRLYVSWIPDRTTQYMATGIVMRRSLDGGAHWKPRQSLVLDHLTTRVISALRPQDRA
jgi:hypothetical protein